MKRGRKLHQTKQERVWARYPSLNPIAIKTRAYQRYYQTQLIATMNWRAAIAVPRFGFVSYA